MTIDYRALGLTEKDVVDAVKALKDAHRQSGRPGTPCDSATCLMVAVGRIVSWPVLPDETSPAYCMECLAKMWQVSEALGIQPVVQRIPVPVPNTDGPVRAFTIGTIEDIE